MDECWLLRAVQPTYVGGVVDVCGLGYLQYAYFVVWWYKMIVSVKTLALQARL
jgi:hypothetical protein